MSLITENHAEEPHLRHNVYTKPIYIQQNAWVGAGAIILPGITIGENAIVAAGSIVTKNVADNTIVAGNPAKPIREIKN
ncbi:DapH/DapD/GlmU-related protein [Apibacter muscae]|uniref:DapH/DapD/GlmU-related protein n=1 Tax=Apibacter muscae TaxID=2509004 RepID=UPI001C876E9A|nr:DapH/DapD/GlmU-related protein [Apibacter muscae]